MIKNITGEQSLVGDMEPIEHQYQLLPTGEYINTGDALHPLGENSTIN